MELWISVLVFFLAAGGVIGLLTQKKEKNKARMTGIVLMSAVMVGALCSGIYSLIFSMPDTDPVPGSIHQTTAASEEATVPTVSETVPETVTAPAPVPETTAEPTEPETEPPMPEDYDLPVEELPAAIPDPLNAGNRVYEESPYFEDKNELTLYFVNRLLAGDLKMEFYLSRKLAPNEVEAIFTMDQALLAASSYYLFHAYQCPTMCIDEVGQEDRVLAHVELIFDNPDYDAEARAEALEYVRKHPVPKGGFQNAGEEQKYVRDIHDYLIKRITYDPIGDSPEILSLSPFEGKQEAYNVLASDATHAVCAGFSRGLALICHYAGIECVFVSGNENPETMESHAWNVIYPCNSGEPLLVDITWDNTDVYYDGEEDIQYTYCNLPLFMDREHRPFPAIQEFLEYVHRADF